MTLNANPMAIWKHFSVLILLSFAIHTEGHNRGKISTPAYPKKHHRSQKFAKKIAGTGINVRSALASIHAVSVPEVVHRIEAETELFRKRIPRLLYRPQSIIHVPTPMFHRGDYHNHGNPYHANLDGIYLHHPSHRRCCNCPMHGPYYHDSFHEDCLYVPPPHGTPHPFVHNCGDCFYHHSIPTDECMQCHWGAHILPAMPAVVKPEDETVVS